MPKLKHIIPHTMNVEDVKSRLQSKLVKALAQNSGDDFILCDESWGADKGHYAFMVGSYSFSIQVHVQTGQINIDGKIPLAALPFRRQIKKDLTTIAKQILCGEG
nr:hypothetical protein [Desulfobulbaceae bacterium]